VPYFFKRSAKISEKKLEPNFLKKKITDFPETLVGKGFHLSN